MHSLALQGREEGRTTALELMLPPRPWAQNPAAGGQQWLFLQIES